jgi:hypothetical protein
MRTALPISLKQVERHPLRRFGADARQTAQGRDQLVQQ